MAIAQESSQAVTSVAIAVGLLGLIIGYFIGQGRSIGVFGGSNGPKQPQKSWPNSYDVKVHVDSSDEEPNVEESDDESEGDGTELKGFEDTNEEVKLVLAVRTDLGMGKGKIAVQASHATLACYKYLLNHAPSVPLLKRWEYGGQPKIAVQVKNEDELLVLQAQAMSLGLCARIIRDAGRTQIAAGSTTVLGVLGPKSVVDQVTGLLKLL